MSKACFKQDIRTNNSTHNNLSASQGSLIDSQL